MNDTHSLDHLQAINHVTAVLNAIRAGGATVSKPKTASTHHFDATGNNVAHVSSTSYEGVNFAADGSISGGNLSHQSVSPEGLPLTTTSIGFQAGGKPASANVDIHNLHSDGLFKKVTMDMSGATWNDQFAIASGQVAVTATDPDTKAKTHDGTIRFDKETLVAGSFTHYDHQGSGAVTGHAEVDYGGAKFLGTSIVGGQYTVRSLQPDKTLSSTSVVAVSPLGRIDSIESTNMGSATEIKTNVKVDFTKGMFNARNEFHSGDLLYNVFDDKGVKLSDTTVTYQNAVPAQSQTQVYEGGALNGKIKVDYSQSQFNNHNQVVNSIKKVEVYNAKDQQISSSMVAYDPKGNKIKAGPAAGVPLQPLRPPVTVQVPALVKMNVSNQPPAANQTQQTDTKKRDDGTVQQVRVTTLEAGKPVSAKITTYGPDGTTVIKSYTMDLSGISYDENSKVATGSLTMQTHLGGTVLQAQSSVQY